MPLAVGFLAQRFGLAWALAALAVAPLLLLACPPRFRRHPGAPDDTPKRSEAPSALVAGGPSPELAS